MPTYQYACTECGHELEAVQKFTDEPLSICPECKGRLRKRYGAVGVVFKGSGFYKTDSRSKASTSAAKSNSPATESSSSGGSSSSDGGSSSSTSSTSTSSTDGSGGSTGGKGSSGDSKVA